MIQQLCGMKQKHTKCTQINTNKSTNCWSAHVETAAAKPSRPLCHMTRSQYIHVCSSVYMLIIALTSSISCICVQESVVEIQYIKREAAPEPGESLLHDDWVSAVHSVDNLYVIHLLTSKCAKMTRKTYAAAFIGCRERSDRALHYKLTYWHLYDCKSTSTFMLP